MINFLFFCFWISLSLTCVVYIVHMLYVFCLDINMCCKLLYFLCLHDLGIYFQFLIISVGIRKGTEHIKSVT